MRSTTRNVNIRYVAFVACLSILLGMLGDISNMRAEKGPSSVSSVPSAAVTVGLTYQWHTFYGNADNNRELRSVAVDSVGNVYIAGYGDKTWQGPDNTSPLHAYSGDYDVVVIKLNSLGAYQWHTFYGAAPTDSENGDDEAADIVVDANGNVYVTGYSDRTWQGVGNTEPLNPHGLSEDMFILKLNSDGAYQWHTFYQSGRAKAIALNSAADVYVTGYSTEEWGTPIHSAIFPGDSRYDGHLVVLKLNSNGAYQWHTYYGAGVHAGDEAGYGIVMDAQNNVYVSGSATYTWQGDADTAPLHPFSGGSGYSTDIVVLKLSGSGAYQWHTFYGANGTDDVGNGIAWGGSGLSVAGQSVGTWGSPLHPYADNRDMVVLRLNTAGQYQWHTFYGAGGQDSGSGVSVDAKGNSYVAGWSSGSWQGDGNASPTHPYSGSGDADIVVLKLNAGGGYQRHTFYGAGSMENPVQDYGLGIALDNNAGLFITGNSQSTWLGDGGTGPLHGHSGNPLEKGDGFVLKLSDRIYVSYLPIAIK